MPYTRDFTWTWADRQAGFPHLHAALAATETDVLIATYESQMRDCLGGFFAHNLRVVQNELARELLRRGVTHIPNLFGPITITDRW